MHVNVIIEQSVVDKINTAIYRFPDMEPAASLSAASAKMPSPEAIPFTLPTFTMRSLR